VGVDPVGFGWFGDGGVGEEAGGGSRAGRHGVSLLESAADCAEARI
jgi:hypothetical protein